MEWAQVLVIILAVFLALFLLLGIILVALLIKVTKQIKDVTSTAQRAANNIETTVSNLSSFSSPLLIGRMVLRGIKKVRK